MLDILVQCQDLLKSLKAKDLELVNKDTDLNIASQKIAKDSAANSAKETQLIKREQEVSTIEDILEIQKSNGIKLREIKDQQAELETSRNAFVSHSEQVKEENLKKEKDFKAQGERLAKEEANLKAALEKFEEDKKNMRADIINSLK